VSELTWEKREQVLTPTRSKERYKFLVGGVLMLAAVVYLILSSTTAGAQYFITVDELMNNPEYIGQTVRISGAVIGETIEYDSENILIDFTIAHIPRETDNLARSLYEAVHDTERARLAVHYTDVKPDLLQNEAQAILTGELRADGVFYANELLLKCPSRYEETVPDQAAAQKDV
jgi:cytochrome c-type biogenesis protein CcmE